MEYDTIRVCTFVNGDHVKLFKEVNEYLNQKHPDQIKDIKFSSSYDGFNVTYSAMVICKFIDVSHLDRDELDKLVKGKNGSP